MSCFLAARQNVSEFALRIEWLLRFLFLDVFGEFRRVFRKSFVEPTVVNQLSNRVLNRAKQLETPKSRFCVHFDGRTKAAKRLLVGTKSHVFLFP